jgi:hypothetical protein
MIGWPVLMLLHNVFASIFALQSRRLAVKYPQAYFQIMVGVFVALYGVFLAYALFHVSEISYMAALQHAPQLLLTGVGFAGHAVLTFLTFRYVDAAVGTLFTVLNLVAIVVVSSITLNETLTPTQILGSFILLTAILIVLLIHLPKKKRHNWHIGLALAIASSFFMGAAVASEKYLLDAIGLPTYAVFGVACDLLCVLLLAFVFGRKYFVLYRNPRFAKDIVLAGVSRAGVGFFFVLALVAADNASLVGATGGLKIVLTAVLAGIILRETQYMPRKLVASLIAFVGVWIMVG